MFSEKCKVRGLKGIKQLGRVGPYIVITNRRLYETGASHRYVLINEAELSVHSIHSSKRAAVTFAQQNTQ